MRGEKEARTFSLGSTPAVCGEKYRGSSRCGQLAGSPPRMRGKGPCGMRQKRDAGITPAYAGKSPKDLRLAGGTWDHPRVCGEKDDVEIGGDFSVGSPPRMRGKGVPKQRCPYRCGITPAYAGKRQGRSGRTRPTGDHPRVCGEKSYCPALSAWTPGSPPRMRGKAADGPAGGPERGITPAYAGKSA